MLNLNGNRNLKGYIKAKILKLPSGGLRVKHAEQRGIWVPTQHLLWDQGKPRKTFIELAGRKTFRIQTDFYDSSPALNTRTLLQHGPYRKRRVQDLF
jgi:hypothetical protein